MINISASVEYQISRLKLADIFLCGGLTLRCSHTWKTVTEIGKYRHYKSWAVCTVCKACSAINIRISFKLQRKVYHFLSLCQTFRFCFFGNFFLCILNCLLNTLQRGCFFLLCLLRSLFRFLYSSFFTNLNCFLFFRNKLLCLFLCLLRQCTCQSTYTSCSIRKRWCAIIKLCCAYTYPLCQNHRAHNCCHQNCLYFIIHFTNQLLLYIVVKLLHFYYVLLRICVC